VGHEPEEEIPCVNIYAWHKHQSRIVTGGKSHEDLDILCDSSADSNNRLWRWSKRHPRFVTTDRGDSKLEFIRCGEKSAEKSVWLKVTNYIDSEMGLSYKKVDRKNPDPALRNAPDSRSAGY